MCAPLRQASRLPNWAIALGIGSVAAGTYGYVLKKVGPNLNQELEAEAARQEEAEKRAYAK
jgi:hypothetical protein